MSELFSGKKLLRNGGGPVEAAELQGKIVAIYFSAHWCPSCRGFTPVLKDFYNELSGGGEFEVVFVSSDRSEKDLQAYLKESHGNWLYLAQNDPFVAELKAKYEIRGIPTLVVIKADGSLITKDGRTAVQKGPPSEALAKWKAA